MSRLSRWLSARASAPAASPPRFVPRMQVLDDRIVPSFLTNIVSTTDASTQVSGTHFAPALSADGRYVAFVSPTAFVAEDTNGVHDVYRKDRMTGAVVLVSRANGVNGAAGNNGVETSTAPSISADGRFVAFSSAASNLAGTDNNNSLDVFVRDIVNGTTQLVSVTADGFIGNANSLLPSISADGKIVSFASDATNLEAGSPAGRNLYHYNLLTRSSARIAAGASLSALSADGRFVAFASDDPVPGDTNGVRDVFVIDTNTFTTTRVSVATGGVEGNGASGGTLDISDDGRWVAFTSSASNLVAGDTNGQTDAFLHDRTTGTTTRVSTNASGTGGNGASFGVAISGNGRFVALSSSSNDLVTGDTNGATDVFVKDRVTGAITRVSVSTAGTEANSSSGSGVAISRDGQFEAYFSGATNLAPDTNGSIDVFVTQRPLPASYAVGVGPDTSANPLVQVFGPDGRQTASFFAYPVAYKGGVFVAMGDVTGDGIDEVVTSTGPGGTANIRVFETATGSFNAPTLLASFFAYPPAFLGGVNAAVGDVNNDGYADVVCGVGKGGGPNVRILDGKMLRTLAAKNDGSLEAKLLDSVANGGTLMASFFAYVESFTGGVRVAVADVDGDGFADVITGVGAGGTANVRVFNAKNTILVNSLPASPTPDQSVLALPATFLGGMFVSTGDVNNDGIPDLLIGVESGGGPNARAYSLNNLDPNNPLRSFFAFDSNLTGGVKVASTDFDQDGFDDFVVGTGPGTPGTYRVFSGKLSTVLGASQPFGANLTSGINVG